MTQRLDISGPRSSFYGAGRDEGFLLLDALIAAAIMATGLIALVNLMPKLMEVSETRRITTLMTSYSLAKQQEILADSYIAIVPAQSGNFTNLLGSSFPGIEQYQWRYTSYDSIPGVLKCVNLVVENTAFSVASDTLTFLVADMKDSVAS